MPWSRGFQDTHHRQRPRLSLESAVGKASLSLMGLSAQMSQRELHSGRDRGKAVVEMVPLTLMSVCGAKKTDMRHLPKSCLPFS